MAKLLKATPTQRKSQEMRDDVLHYMRTVLIMVGQYQQVEANDKDPELKKAMLELCELACSFSLLIRGPTFLYTVEMPTLRTNFLEAQHHKAAINSESRADVPSKLDGAVIVSCAVTGALMKECLELNEYWLLHKAEVVVQTVTHPLAQTFTLPLAQTGALFQVQEVVRTNVPRNGRELLPKVRPIALEEEL